MLRSILSNWSKYSWIEHYHHSSNFIEYSVLHWEKMEKFKTLFHNSLYSRIEHRHLFKPVCFVERKWKNSTTLFYNFLYSSASFQIYVERKFCQIYFTIIISSINIIQLIQIFVNWAPSSLQTYFIERKWKNLTSLFHNFLYSRIEYRHLFKSTRKWKNFKTLFHNSLYFWMERISLQTCIERKFCQFYFTIIIPSIDIIQLIQIFVNRAPSSFETCMFHRKKNFTIVIASINIIQLIEIH